MTDPRGIVDFFALDSTYMTPEQVDAYQTGELITQPVCRFDPWTQDYNRLTAPPEEAT